MKVRTKRSKFSNGNLTEGIYNVQIISAKSVFRKQKLYSDETPMLEVTFHHIDSSRVVQRSYSFVGFKKDDNGKYVTDENRKRILDNKKTDIARSFIFKLFKDSGVEPINLDFDKYTGFAKLNEKSIGISVILNEEKRPIVEFTMPTELLEKQEFFEKLRMIEKIFKRLLKKTSKEILENSDSWYGSTFDNLYDMETEELKKRYDKVSIIVRSKKP